MSWADDVATDVAAEGTAVDSAVAMINAFAAHLAAAGTDPTKIAALRSDIQAKTAKLAAAVVANTPAATPGAPPVTPAAAASLASAAVATANAAATSKPHP